MTPKRIQMTRNKPWRADNPDAVIVDRRTPFGNPFKVGGLIILTGPKAGKRADAADCVRFYRNSLKLKQNVAARAQVREALAGKDLACWCKIGAPCHADVLLEIANGKESAK